MNDDTLINAVKHNSWYIINSFLYKIQETEKVINNAKKSLENDDGSDIYQSLKNNIFYCEQSLREHKNALEQLRNAGLK